MSTHIAHERRGVPSLYVVLNQEEGIDIYGPEGLDKPPTHRLDKAVLANRPLLPIEHFDESVETVLIALSKQNEYLYVRDGVCKFTSLAPLVYFDSVLYDKVKTRAYAYDTEGRLYMFELSLCGWKGRTFPVYTLKDCAARMRDVSFHLSFYDVGIYKPEVEKGEQLDWSFPRPGAYRTLDELTNASTSHPNEF